MLRPAAGTAILQPVGHLATRSLVRGDAYRAREDMTDRITGWWAAKQVLGRVLLPAHAWRRRRLRRNHERTPTAEGNAQLLLYSRMLAGDFLHYGYFDDPDTPPETISFDGLRRAQLRYAEKIMAAVGRPNPGSPVLDVGSGMGGMLGMLLAAGHEATGLTPDRHQVEHIRRAYPDAAVLRCRFEEMPAGERRGRFGTVVHAESIQYMEPDRVFHVVDEALADGGRWIVADYFRKAPGAGGAERGAARSGWALDAFRELAERTGWGVVQEEDMTAHVVPTLAFARMLAERIGLPVLDFAQAKLRAKRPGAHYVLEPLAERARMEAARSLDALDPEEFARRKRYLLMTLQRD